MEMEEIKGNQQPFLLPGDQPQLQHWPSGLHQHHKGLLLSGRHSPGLFPSGLRNTRPCPSWDPLSHPFVPIYHPRQQVSAVKESLFMPRLLAQDLGQA